jgi:hypothetical protein
MSNSNEDTEMGNSQSEDKMPNIEANADDQDVDMDALQENSLPETEVTSNKQGTETNEYPTVVFPITEKWVKHFARSLLKSVPQNKTEIHSEICLKPGQVLTEEFLSRVAAEMAADSPHQTFNVTQGPPGNPPGQPQPLARPGYFYTECGAYALDVYAECGAREKQGGGSLYRCSECKVRRYCSVEWQRKQWLKHKPLCEGMGAAKAALNARKSAGGEGAEGSAGASAGSS